MQKRMTWEEKKPMLGDAIMHHRMLHDRTHCTSDVNLMLEFPSQRKTPCTSHLIWQMFLFQVRDNLKVFWQLIRTWPLEIILAASCRCGKAQLGFLLHWWTKGETPDSTKQLFQPSLGVTQFTFAADIGESSRLETLSPNVSHHVRLRSCTKTKIPG